MLSSVSILLFVCFFTGLAGLVVIDVVEGTAMDALSSMQSFLRGRPQKFNSLQNAIEWRYVFQWFPMIPGSKSLFNMIFFLRFFFNS